jgi:hypothetical protein
MPDPIRKKIDDRMDKLQAIMESNEHLTNPEKAIGLTHRISPFWSILSEEDREYVQCAQHAIEDQLEWNV